MNKVDVWMPLYIGDYLSSTSRLTTEQHGAYLLLIMDYWKNDPLPDDDAIPAQISRMTPDAWSNARSIVRAFFVLDSGMLTHGRIDAELADARAGKVKRKAKATAAAEARWSKYGDKCSGDAPGNAPSAGQALLEECPSPSQVNQPIESAVYSGSGTPAGLVCYRLKTECKIVEVNPMHPKLLALLAAGITAGICLCRPRLQGQGQGQGLCLPAGGC